MRSPGPLFPILAVADRLLSAGPRREKKHGPRIHEQKKFESFERINSIRETNGNFDSCNSCKRLGTSRLHEMHESKFPFVSRIEFIRSKLSNFSAHVSGVMDRSANMLIDVRSKISPVLTAVPTLFATVRARPGPFCTVKTASRWL